jgi:hypothetical protein
LLSAAQNRDLAIQVGLVGFLGSRNKFGTISKLGTTMVRQNRAAMVVEKLRVFWNFMYREELKRYLQSFIRFYSFH